MIKPTSRKTIIWSVIQRTWKYVTVTLDTDQECINNNVTCICCGLIFCFGLIFFKPV